MKRQPLAPLTKKTILLPDGRKETFYTFRRQAGEPGRAEPAEAAGASEKKGEDARCRR